MDSSDLAVIMGGLYKTPQNSRAVYLLVLVQKGGSRGEEQTLDIPDALDAVDADYILQGLGVHAWRRPRRVRRVGWWFLRGSEVKTSLLEPGVLK